MGFSETKRLDILLEMLTALESGFSDTEFSAPLKESILNCLYYLKEDETLQDIRGKSYTLENFSEVIYLRDSLNRVRSKNLRDSDIYIKRYDVSPEQKSKFPVVVILDNLRSAFNVGSIIRSSECLGAEKVYLCGTTPGLNNKKMVDTAMGTTDFIELESCASTEEAIVRLQKEGYQVCAIELVSNAISLNDFTPLKKVAIVLGNESLGIDESIVELCDLSLVIPMHGWKNSLNVGTAGAIVLYDVVGKISCNSELRIDN